MGFKHREFEPNYWHWNEVGFWGSESTGQTHQVSAFRAGIFLKRLSNYEWKLRAERYPHIEVLDHVNLFDVATLVFALLSNGMCDVDKLQTSYMETIKKYKRHVVRNPTWFAKMISSNDMLVKLSNENEETLFKHHAAWFDINSEINSKTKIVPESSEVRLRIRSCTVLAVSIIIREEGTRHRDPLPTRNSSIVFQNNICRSIEDAWCHHGEFVTENASSAVII